MLEPTPSDLRPNDPIAHLVRQLPEDSLSMTWRAELNEKLRAESARQTRVRRWSFGSLGLGLATASFAALVVVPMLIGGPRSISTPGMVSPMARPLSDGPIVAAEDLLALDGEGAALSEVSGAGIAAAESDLSEGEVQYVLASQML